MNDNQNLQLDSKKRSNALYFVYVRLIGDILALLATGFFTLQLGTWFGYTISGIVFGIMLTSLTALLFIQFGRINHGIQILVLGFSVGIFTISLFVSGMGLFALAGGALITTLVVATTIPRANASRLIITSVIVGILALTFDSLVGQVDPRVVIPNEMEFTLMATIWGVLAISAAITSIPVIRQFPTFSLPTKVLTSYVIISIFSFVVLGLVNYWSVTRALTNEANESLHAAASQTAASITSFFNNTISEVEVQARLPVFIELLDLPRSRRAGSQEESRVSELFHVLEQRSIGNDRSPAYFLLDDAGNTLVPSQSQYYSSDIIDTIYPLIEKEKVSISDVLSISSHKSVIVFSSPIVDESEESPIILGLLVMIYDAFVLQDTVEQSNGLVGKDSFAVLFDEYYIHLAHGISPETMFTTLTPLNANQLAELQRAGRLPDRPTADLSLDLQDLAQHLDEVVSGSGPQYFASEDIATGGRLNQIVVVPLSETEKPWLLAFFQPQDIYLAPVKAINTQTVFLSLFISAFVIGVALFVTGNLTRPILNLTQAAQKISEGDFSAKAEMENPDEIGNLAVAFNNMAQQLRLLVTNLEEQVSERTLDLEKRVDQVRTAAEVARDATAETDMDDLLYQTATMLADRFNFHHVGIYLTDSNNKYAVLMATNGNNEQELKIREHKIEIGYDTLVGHVTQNGTPQFVSYTQTEGQTYQHPILEDTRSQLVLPLQVGSRILGAVDIHDLESNAFDQDDVAIFRTMADQISVAIQKIELRNEVEQTLRELESSTGQFTREAWRTFIPDSDSSLGYRFRQLRVEKTDDLSEATLAALQKGHTVVLSENDANNYTTIALPIKIRGEVVGVLDLKYEAADIPSTSKPMLEEIANRLSLVLENTRLIEAAQKRVQLERLFTEITSSIRENLDMDTVLQSAVQEIGKNFRYDEVEIRMGIPPQADPRNGTFDSEPFDDDDIDLDTLIG
jgi:nitrate/nitrite-specific signal transduction histidine kinase